MAFGGNNDKDGTEIFDIEGNSWELGNVIPEGSAHVVCAPFDN
jgi:hypothetical protein